MNVCYRGFAGLTGSIGNSFGYSRSFNNENTSLRAPSNVFILSLAFADMSVTAFMEPVSAYAILLEWELSQGNFIPEGRDCVLPLLVCVT